jgi:3-phenylpropionate/trans-cinnamate dioxygenase ferredoxin reductase subunit
MNDHILIIGAGQSGMQIAVSLREEGFDGQITLVGDEPHPPYQRPPLSKAFLAGEADDASLTLRNAQFYDDHNITVVTGQRIISVERGAQGGVARSEAGREFPYTSLALTTGASPKMLDVDGAALRGVYYLRTLADAQEILQRWATAARVVVVGGGFIGLEIAAVAQKAGKTVTVLQRGDRLMGRSVSPIVSDFYVAAHHKRGTTIRLNTSLTRVIGDSGIVTGVELATGETLDADLVLVGIGVTPRSELAEAMGLATVDGRVVVDEFAQTSAPNVVAAGDAVVFPHPSAAGSHICLESVQNAVDQAKVAAKTLMGVREAYQSVPWFWSDQADLKLQIAGLSHGYDHTVIRGNLDEESFSVLYYREGQLIAIDAINSVSDYMAVKRALSSGDSIPADSASDSSTPLKTLITSGKG